MVLLAAGVSAGQVHQHAGRRFRAGRGDVRDGHHVGALLDPRPETQVCSFRVPGNAELRDFTVADAGVWAILERDRETTVAGNFCFPLGVWGSPPAAFNNALVRRVRSIGDTDSLNVNASSPCSGTFEELRIPGEG